MKIGYFWSSALALGLTVVAPLTSCSQQPSSSNILVTDVAQSQVKRQSIGNCWLYATASWLESSHLSATGNEINVSETYWTWWHFYNGLVGSSSSTLQTGGSFGIARNIILSRGYLLENEFVPSEANSQMSGVQKQAETYLKTQMAAGGTLATAAQRTPANVTAQLDIAFGSNMAQAQQLAHSSQSLVMGQAGNQALTLADALTTNSPYRWRSFGYPRIYGQTAVADANTQAQRNSLMLRVMKALNDRKPVIVSLMIDFNALDIADATFKRSTLEQAGTPGKQGGHMVVLEDYVVDNVPGVGTIGEGDVSPELKQLALQGTLRFLKSKNSWGTNRPERGLTDGYTRFDSAYLNGQLAWKVNEADANSAVSYYTTLTDFTLPPGY